MRLMVAACLMYRLLANIPSSCDDNPCSLRSKSLQPSQKYCGLRRLIMDHLTQPGLEPGCLFSFQEWNDLTRLVH